VRGVAVAEDAGLAHRTTPGAFAHLCAVGFLAYCSYAICRTPLLPLLARELGAAPVTVGFVVGASTLTGVLVKLPAGAWSDVLGRRPLLLLGATVFAAMPFTYIGVASLGVLVALRFTHGAATAIFGPVASASLSDLAPPGRRGTWLSTYSTIQGAGQALGPVIAGYVIVSGRYDPAFGFAGLLGLASLILALRWPQTSPSRQRQPRRDALRQFSTGIADVCRAPLILMTSVAQAAQFVLNGALNGFLPLFARDVLGAAPSTLGWLFALQTVTMLAVRPAIGMLSDRIGRRGVIITGPDGLQQRRDPGLAGHQAACSAHRDRHLRRRRGRDDGGNERVHYRSLEARAIRRGTRRLPHYLRRGRRPGTDSGRGARRDRRIRAHVSNNGGHRPRRHCRFLLRLAAGDAPAGMMMSRPASL
jgi:MFS family permease